MKTDVSELLRFDSNTGTGSGISGGVMKEAFPKVAADVCKENAANVSLLERNVLKWLEYEHGE